MKNKTRNLFFFTKEIGKKYCGWGLVSAISSNYEGALWKLFGTGLTMVSVSQHSLSKLFLSCVCLVLHGREA